MAVALFALAQCAVLAVEPVQTTAADPRLNQKVTYEGGYKRLRQVTEELSKQTGVAIYCGKNDSDWPVRDIPLVVCVRDMPLGKLLRLLALTSHTQYVSKKSKSQTENERTYRIYRSPEQEKDISSLLRKRRDAKLALADWSWDALVKLGHSPEEAGGEKHSRILGKILASLGPDAKKKLFDGERIDVRGKDSSQVQELYRWAREDLKPRMGASWREAPEPTQAELERTTLTLYLEDPNGENNRTGVSVNLSPICGGDGNTVWFDKLDSQASDLRSNKELGLTARPEDTGPPAPQDEMSERALDFLDVNRDADWTRPALQLNAKLDMPEGKKQTTTADLITALAKAAGLSVICEDFVSHKGNPGDRNSYFGPKVEVGSTLRKAALNNTDWFIDDEQKLLIGWATNWRNRHSNLVSAAYLAGLRRNLNGDGLEIDDVTPLANMTSAQFYEWIALSRDLSILSQDLGRTLWRFYDLLKPEDKAQAKSEAGLPLGTLDPEGIAAFCREQKIEITGFGMREIARLLGPEAEAEMQRKDRVLSDPRVISTLIMRVKSEPGGTRQASRFVNGRLQMTLEPTPPLLDLHTYRIELEGVEENQPITITVPGPYLAFPVYSPEREAEILKAKSKEGQPSTPK